MLKETHKAEIDDILSRYPVSGRRCYRCYISRNEEQGYVTESAMQEIAGILKLTPPQVYETATFYTMLNLKPVGKVSHSGLQIADVRARRFGYAHRLDRHETRHQTRRDDGRRICSH